MGPRLVGRGKSAAIASDRSLHVALQWGRDSLVAESLRPPLRSKSVSRASMGPRLVGRGKLRETFCWLRLRPASMGPRLVGRGKAEPSVGPVVNLGASMGPRLVGRGKAKAMRLELLRSSLQWGRDSLVAERKNSPDSSSTQTPASMGPRLVSRGKRIATVASDRHRDASMGPRLVSRGK